MAIVVEDGTALATAETYASVAAADAYYVKLDIPAWAALTLTAKEASLRKATAYMIQMYRGRWQGQRAKIGQALDWPRTGVTIRDFYYFEVPFNTVPVEVVTACISLALRASTAELLADQQPRVASESVGPISVSYFAGEDRAIVYAAIERTLQPLFRQSSSGGIQITRS